MLGIQFIKTQPTTHLMLFRRGRVVREGAGLSFFYYAPSSTLVATARPIRPSRHERGAKRHVPALRDPRAGLREERGPRPVRAELAAEELVEEEAVARRAGAPLVCHRVLRPSRR